MRKPTYKPGDDYHKEHARADALRESGAEWFTWLSAGDGGECAACKAADGVILPIGEMNVPAHHAACINPNGCRCVCGPCDPDECPTWDT